MTVLALRLSSNSNGVSKLHGDVSRRMWQGLWPAVPTDEIPIQHITNGVHFSSWISLEMNQLYDRYLGPQWREEPANKRCLGSRKFNSSWRALAHTRAPSGASGCLGAQLGTSSTVAPGRTSAGNRSR